MTEYTDADWVRLLSANDPAALTDLRAALVRGLQRGLTGRADADAVEDFAQEAVLKVLAGLGSFRGDSRFLTWALAIGLRVAFSELRKARWRDVSLDWLRGDEGRAFPEPAARETALSIPEDRDDLLGVLRRLIETLLTDRQRALIQAELAGIPQVVIAERLGSNRNALYKLGHDARVKLRQGLLASGVSVDDVRGALFSA